MSKRKNNVTRDDTFFVINGNDKNSKFFISLAASLPEYIVYSDQFTFEIADFAFEWLKNTEMILHKDRKSKVEQCLVYDIKQYASTLDLSYPS